MKLETRNSKRSSEVSLERVIDECPHRVRIMDPERGIGMVIEKGHQQGGYWASAMFLMLPNGTAGIPMLFWNGKN